MKWLLVLMVIAAGVWYFLYRQPAPPPTPTVAESAPTPPPRHLAPQGVYYLLQQVSITSDSGIVGVGVGTKVTFVKDTGQSWVVTDGQNQFEVQQNQVTNDLDVIGAVLKKTQDMAAAAADAVRQREAADKAAREAEAEREAQPGH